MAERINPGLEVCDDDVSRGEENLMAEEHVELYVDAADQYRWRRKAENGEIVSDSSEGYWNRDDCLDMAERINPGLWIKEEDA